MNESSKSYLYLHIAVFLFGITAILGDLINLDTYVLVWWRMLITSISLILLIWWKGQLKFLTRANLLRFGMVGIIVAIHWLSFFGSIKMANASIALICLATVSFLTAILEPIILKTKHNYLDIGIGALIIPGMILIVKGVDFSMYAGIAAGLLSGLMGALFSIFNKKFIKHAPPTTISCIELSSGWIFLCLLLPFVEITNFLPASMDWVYLIILSLLCTTLAYSLAVSSLKTLTAFVSNLIINLEPVYGIFLAIWILNEDEELGNHFYWGVALIMLTVFSYPLIKRIMRKNAPKIALNKKNN